MARAVSSAKPLVLLGGCGGNARRGSGGSCDCSCGHLVVVMLQLLLLGANGGVGVVGVRVRCVVCSALALLFQLLSNDKLSTPELHNMPSVKCDHARCIFAEVQKPSF